MKVGIIGSGIAGLGAAWLLEQNHEVILFEKNSFFGGHAHTIYAKQGTVPVEIGFEFFNQRMYPHFCRLLSLLSVSVTQYPFSYSFFSDQSSGYVLPPIQGRQIYWHSLTPGKIRNLLHLKKAIRAGQELIASGQKTISLAEFAQQAGLPESFMHQFFYPLFSAGWGVDHEEFATFSAYNVLSYIVKNKPIGLQPSWWYEIKHGMSSYINSLTNALAHTKLHSSSPVERIDYDNNRYTITTPTNQYVFDHLIIATDAHSAQQLVKTISHAQRVTDALHTISFIPATLAIHQDTRFMPHCKKNWSVANVWHNKNYSTLTIYKNRTADYPYFRSWLLPGFPEPNHTYALQQYHHAKPNKNYFMTQQVIADEQGTNNLWLAGLYTNDIDSHESALNSAITIAQKLCPQSARLNQLLTAA